MSYSDVASYTVTLIAIILAPGPVALMLICNLHARFFILVVHAFVWIFLISCAMCQFEVVKHVSFVRLRVC